MTTILEFYISEKIRKKTIDKFSEYFNHDTSVLIESGILNFCHQYCEGNTINYPMAEGIYINCVDNLLFNFESKNPTIKRLTKDIKKGKYNAYNLAFLRPEELDEGNWEKIIKRRNTTEDKLNNLPSIEWKACRICKNVYHFYYQLQTRSADEPMTTFYRCKKCDKTTKVNN